MRQGCCVAKSRVVTVADAAPLVARVNTIKDHITYPFLSALKSRHKKRSGTGFLSGTHLLYARTHKPTGDFQMATPAKRRVRREWTTQDIRELKKHSKSKTSVAVLSRTTKRTPGALRQKARVLGIPLGHHR